MGKLLSMYMAEPRKPEDRERRNHIIKQMLKTRGAETNRFMDVKEKSIKDYNQGL